MGQGMDIFLVSQLGLEPTLDLGNPMHHTLIYQIISVSLGFHRRFLQNGCQIVDPACHQTNRNRFSKLLRNNLSVPVIRPTKDCKKSDPDITYIPSPVFVAAPFKNKMEPAESPSFIPTETSAWCPAEK